MVMPKDVNIENGCMIGKSQKRTDFQKLLKSKNPNMLININGLSFGVSVNSEVYSQEDCSRICEIVDHMANDIWLDRTYVNYPGNRFKDSFINEDAWYNFIHLCVSSNFGKKSKKIDKEITEALVTMSIVYIFDVVRKYGYSMENINIEVSENSNFNVSYFVDNRKNWNY